MSRRRSLLIRWSGTALILTCTALTAQTSDMSVFAGRRAALMETMNGGFAFLRNPDVVTRNSDNTYPYRASSDFYYLTGLEEANAVMMLLPGEAKRFILFVEPRNSSSMLWFGDLPGIEGAMSVYGADTAYALSELDFFLARRAGMYDTVYFDLKNRDDYDAIFSRAAGMYTWRRPAVLMDLLKPVHEMRLIKDESEIALLQRAIDITCSAHRAAARAAFPGILENELGAVLDFEYKRHGSMREGFPSIIGSGPNSCVFHYEKNTRRTEAGDLIVLDIGAEYGMYTADVTRTIPVSGLFTPEQRAVYRIVLDAQQAAIQVMKPGNTQNEMLQAAEAVIKKGLFSLGLITDPGTTWQHLAYYYDAISHMLGMDVHDVGDPTEWFTGQGTYRPGMVLTIEPGLYIAETMLTNFKETVVRRPDVSPEDVEAFIANIRPVFDRYRDTGIRIEDDILITEKGNRILSSAAPRTVESIEALMREPLDLRLDSE
ncbi:aminopeptidase P N-terminal domain-containing protein [bacterium]|nr:aminopeptidase P N-terminal domain-containing protein [bacterium]